MATDLAGGLVSALEARRATVGVIGLGYVGLPLLACLHGAGHRVIGFDIDPAKPAALGRGENYLPHLGVDLCRGFVASERFAATTDERELTRADACIICVPTPLGVHNEPDLSSVHRTGEMLGRIGAAGKLIVLESTSYPGTTRGQLWPAVVRGHLDAKHPGVLQLGVNVLLAFSPEREDPGRKDHTTKTIPKLVGGVDAASTRAAVALYAGAIDKVIAVRSAEVAEAAKVFENVFRAVNIALANELKTVLEPMGIDVWEVIEAASSKPFGFMPFYPGPGLGGHCIPIDPYYLAWKAREHKVRARLIELAGEINTAMPERVVSAVARALSDRGLACKGAKVLVLGLAYKPDISDVRESPSFELIERLQSRGCVVRYADPHVPRTWAMRKHDLGLESSEPTPENIAWADAVLISTAHSAFDWPMIARHARLVVDTRNVMAPWANLMGERLHKA
ncbi:MAG: nucleotide sugar dehydrogenase [bacterium]